MSRFLMTDCKNCGEPQVSVNRCEFDCFEEYCDYCFEVLKQCFICRRRGCDEHFDGHICHECMKENIEVKNESEA